LGEALQIEVNPGSVQREGCAAKIASPFKLLTQSTKRFITALGGSGFVVEAA
jgi:hypothetical protein